MDNKSPNSPKANNTDIMDLYDLTTSRNGECYTVLFHTKSTFDDIADLLTELYNFQPNRNQTALTTSTFVNQQKVVLTLYLNNKLLIQGTGNKIWVETVFKDLCEQLSPSQSTTVDFENKREKTSVKHLDTPIPAKRPSNNKSPLNLLGRLFSMAASPLISTSPVTNSNAKKLLSRLHNNSVGPQKERSPSR